MASLTMSIEQLPLIKALRAMKDVIDAGALLHVGTSGGRITSICRSDGPQGYVIETWRDPDDEDSVEGEHATFAAAFVEFAQIAADISAVEQLMEE